MMPVFNPDKLKALQAKLDAAPTDIDTPLPAGEYVAETVKGEMTESKAGNPTYRVTFRVTEGDHKGRLFFHNMGLSDSALSYTKRDMLRLGVGNLDELNGRLSQALQCKVRLAVRQYDGRNFNKVVTFAVIESPEGDDVANPYPPSED